MTDIASYLWAGQFFEDTGDPNAGRRVFTAKRRATCHNDASSGAPKIAGGDRTFSSAAMGLFDMRIMMTFFAAAALTATGAFAADAKAGKSCHGAEGAPNASIAKMMKVEIVDLKSADVQKLSTDDIKKIVTDGKGKMKPVKTVTNVDDVVAFVKTLK